VAEKRNKTVASESIIWTLPGEKSVQKVIEDFLLAKRSEGLSKTTIKLYTQHLKQFGLWVTSQGIEIYPEITINDYRLYIARELERGVKPRSAHVTYRILRTLSYWYEGEHRKEYTSPYHDMKAPKLPKDKQPVTDPQVMEMLLDACNGHRNDERDRLLLLTVYDAGLRVSEVANLSIFDINLRTGKLSIRRAKGNKDRSSFVIKSTLRQIRKYLKNRGSTFPEDPLFPTDEGDYFSYPGLRSLLMRIQTKAGIKVHGWHSLRRGFSTEFINDGGDWGELARILGHESIETTRRYVNLSDDHIKNEHDQYSPAGKLRRRK